MKDFMRRFLTVFFLCGLLLSGGCAQQPPVPRTLNLTEERLGALIARRFPYRSTLLEVLDVQLRSPRLTLDAPGNRIDTSLALEVSGALLRKTYRGTLDLSYGLRFEAQDGTVRMSDVQLRQCTVEGAPEALQRLLGKLGNTLMKSQLQEYVLYQLKPEDLQAVNGAGYRPGVLRVVPGGLSLTLEPTVPAQ